MKKRTNMDFSKHQHRVELFKNGEKQIRVDHLQIEDSSCLYIQFINTDRVLTVTGDFGNWVFCRPFIPSTDGSVSDMYWIEKLRLQSKQVPGSYDGEETEKEIKELIDSGLEEYGYHGEELEKAKKWYKELLSYTDDEYEYIYHAYREFGRPSFIDIEEVPFCKKLCVRLDIIFDAFEEICRRIKNNNNK